MNRIFTQVITVTLLISVLPTLSAQVHPKEALGRKVFDSFRNQDFRSLYDSSIFSLSEQNFKFLIKNIRNQALRND